MRKLLLTHLFLFLLISSYLEAQFTDYPWAELDKARIELQVFKKDLKSAYDGADKLRELLSNSEVQLKVQKEENQRIRIIVIKKEKRIRELDADNKLLRAENTNLKEELRQKDLLVDSLKIVIDSLNNTIIILKNTIGNLESEIADLKEKIKKIRALWNKTPVELYAIIKENKGKKKKEQYLLIGGKKEHGWVNQPNADKIIGFYAKVDIFLPYKDPSGTLSGAKVFVRRKNDPTKFITIPVKDFLLNDSIPETQGFYFYSGNKSKRFSDIQPVPKLKKILKKGIIGLLFMRKEEREKYFAKEFIESNKTYIYELSIDLPSVNIKPLGEFTFQ